MGTPQPSWLTCQASSPDRTSCSASTKAMLGDVWTWAGEYRLTDTNIGVPHPQIREHLLNLYADARTWLEHGVYLPGRELWSDCITCALWQSTPSVMAMVDTLGWWRTLSLFDTSNVTLCRGGIVRYTRQMRSGRRTSTRSWPRTTIMTSALFLRLRGPAAKDPQRHGSRYPRMLAARSKQIGAHLLIRTPPGLWPPPFHAPLCLEKEHR